MPEHRSISYAAMQQRFHTVWQRRTPGDGEPEGEIVPPKPPMLSGGVVIVCYPHDARTEERSLTNRALRRYLDGILTEAEAL